MAGESVVEEWGSGFDPMFEEFLAAEERLSEEERSSEAFEEAMDAWSLAEIGPWDREGWERPVSDPAAEEREAWEVEAALAALDYAEEEGVEESGVEGVSVERPVSSSLPGEAVVSSSLSEALSEAAGSFESFVSGGRRLREGVSVGEFDDFGDRVDVDGREARGLVRSEGASGDGRRYWWAVSVWCREIGVEEWSSEFVSSKELEGLAILHDRDRVDPHVHAVVRRRGGRLKASAAFVRKAVARLWCVPAEAVSVSAVDDTRSAVAYLTHESAAGPKHKYPREEVVESGVALSDWLAEGSTDWVDVVSEMQSVLDDVLARRERLSFRGFLSWCHVERPDWWRVLVVKRSARLYIRDYINS